METKKKGEWCEITVPAKWNGISIESLLKIEWEIPEKVVTSASYGKRCYC